ncbi:hypothetical protein PSTG_06470 [Puccinia striiformis f. sp. tritici PST-78]|uniref:DUF7918 domain-containing protein n=1 Tax=Puccinia striiformis f. sp. tritici PST-78 TaxID=1165861 RepID=A0A0L0VM49_9BASI|nr:hypothetical protein PSTG_06470 [Puccinia striiformis f. sp. tritici PST-78]
MPTNKASGAWCTINLIQPSPSDGTSTKTACQEYKHETSTDATTGAIQEIVTIESQHASPFEMVINVQPTTYSLINQPSLDPESVEIPEPTLNDYYFEYFLDGISIGHSRQPRLNPTLPRYASKIYSSDYATIRLFQFANVNLVDPDDYQDQSITKNEDDKICDDEKVIKAQPKLNPTLPRYASKIYSSDYATIRLFQFANVNLVDPDDYQDQSTKNEDDKICDDEKVIKALGTIRVDVTKVTLAWQPRLKKDRQSSVIATTNQMKFSERSKKACLATTAGLSLQSSSDRSPPVMDWFIKSKDPNPFLQFIFKYKPRSILESEGTIVPVKAEEITIDSDTENEVKKNLNNKRIKAEEEEEEEKELVNNKRVKEEHKPKIIDLTNSDDEGDD